MKLVTWLLNHPTGIQMLMSQCSHTPFPSSLMDTLLQILHTSLSISIPSFLYRLVEGVLSHSVRVWEEGSRGGGNLEGGGEEGEEMEDNGECCDRAGSKCDTVFAVLLSMLYKAVVYASNRNLNLSTSLNCIPI